MFDKLVESTKSKQGRRASRYLVITSAVYALALLALVVGTIIGFSPALAEEYALQAMLNPPVPRDPSPPVVTQAQVRTDTQVNSFTPPIREIPVLPPDEAARIQVMPAVSTRPIVGIPGDGNAVGTGVIGAGRDSGTPPAPPPPTPTPEIKLAPTPEVKATPTRVSEGVLQGGAIRRQKPIYPVSAKAIRASGPVQVIVTISEEGKVIEAYAASGHPMLRAAAVEAARQWLFTPTTLSKVPVKVQGMLTFNFMLE